MIGQDGLLINLNEKDSFLPVGLCPYRIGRYGQQGYKNLRPGRHDEVKGSVRVFKANNGDVMAEATFRNVLDSTIKLVDMLDSSIFVDVSISGRFEAHKAARKPYKVSKIK